MNYLLLFLIGVIFWPVLEYSLHRLLGHDYPGKNIFYKEHTTHHAKPFYFAPGIYKVMAAIIVCAILTALLWLITSKLLASFIFIAGFISMYLFYEWTHYSIHAFPPKTSYGMWVRKHHLAHHFHSPKKNFGVTQTWFDHVFKTHLPTPIVKVPKAFAPQWLLDEPKKFIGQLELK